MSSSLTTLIPDKSPEDKREYRVVILPNGLKAVLCHDPHADKAGAALDVYVGQLSDPSNVHGLAHFLEHMLFMGTKKYPDENSYSAVLNKYGGYSNAWTALEHTNYQFEVLSTHLEEMLDRFAQFFIAPLFTPSGTDREMKAVHSEHQKNLQSDGWRIYQLLRSTANPKHSLSQFGTGSLETLRDAPAAAGINTRDELLKFHAKYYSANVMTLAIVGKDSLDTLQDWTVKYFGEIPNHNIKPPQFSNDILLPEQMGIRQRIVPVEDRHSLEMFWVLPEDITTYKTGPLSFISHLLGYEGAGSVLSYLKAKGWCTSLSAYRNLHTSAFSSFELSMDLTEAGLSKTNEIARVVYEFIALVLHADDNLLATLFQEHADMSAMKFRFRDKSNPFNYVTNLSETLQMVDEVDVVTTAKMNLRCDIPLIRKYLKQMIPQNSRVCFISPSFKGKTDLTERWYGTEYSSEALTADELADLAAILKGDVRPSEQDPGENDVKVHLPNPNPYIATDFTVYTAEAEGEKAAQPEHGDWTRVAPECVPVRWGTCQCAHENKSSSASTSTSTSTSSSTAGDASSTEGGPSKPGYLDEREAPITLYYKLDRVYSSPKANCAVLIRAPASSSSARAVALSRMYSDLVEETLNEITYDAQSAGLYFSFSSFSSGLSVEIHGFSHKMKVLLDTCLKSIRDLKVDRSRFALVKERRVRDLRNWSIVASPINLARTYARAALITNEYQLHEILAITETITAEDIEHHIEDIFRTASAYCLAFGNLTREQAVELSKATYATLRTSPPFVSEVINGAGRTVMLPVGSNTIYPFSCFNPAEPNSAMYSVWQLGTSTVRQAAMNEILRLATSESSFDTLRTKEQLGYMVGSGVGPVNGVDQFIVSIQSLRDPVYLHGRAESWVENVMLSEIKDMTKEAFEEFRSAAIRTLEQKDTSPRQEFSRYVSEIQSERFMFDRRFRIGAELRSITQEEFIEYVLNHITVRGNSLRKFTTMCYSKSIPAIAPGVEYSFDLAQEAKEEATSPSPPSPAEPSPVDVASPVDGVVSLAAPAELKPPPSIDHLKTRVISGKEASRFKVYLPLYPRLAYE